MKDLLPTWSENTVAIAWVEASGCVTQHDPVTSFIKTTCLLQPLQVLKGDVPPFITQRGGTLNGETERPTHQAHPLESDHLYVVFLRSRHDGSIHVVRALPTDESGLITWKSSAFTVADLGDALGRRP